MPKTLLQPKRSNAPWTPFQRQAWLANQRRRRRVARTPLPPSLLTGLAAYWDGDSAWDEVGWVELVQADGGRFGSPEILPNGAAGLLLEAFNESDHFYSKSAVFTDFSAQTVNCWFKLLNWQGMFLLTNCSDNGVGWCTGIGIRFCPDGEFYEIMSAYNGEWDYRTATLAEGQVSQGTWFMLTYTSDDNELRVYINGEWSATLIKTGPTITYTGQGPESFYVNGPHPWGSLIGQACYLGVWERVLGAEEINQLYNQGGGLAFRNL